jgi:hypothetical protein
MGHLGGPVGHSIDDSRQIGIDQFRVKPSVMLAEGSNPNHSNAGLLHLISSLVTALIEKRAATP